MDQSRMPLLEAVERFAGQKPAYFRIPAHRFSRGVNPGFLEAAGEKMFSCDLTEAEGLDDLHIAHNDPEGAYYVLLDISEYGYESDLQFCKNLAREVGVGAVPGSSFFRENPS